MRQIGNLPNENDAHRLANYLLTLRIATRIEREDGRWAVWVCDEDQVPRARAELEEFQRNPEAPRYQKAADEAQAVRREEERQERAYRRNFIDLRDRFDRAVSARRPVTLALIAISVVVALFSQFGEAGELLRSALSITPYIREGDWIRWMPGLIQIQEGQVWRLVTPIFIHFDVIHLLFNMLALYYLGGLVETRRGSLWLLFLVVIIAIPSNLGQYLAGGPSFGGMSGVVFGLFGYAWMKGRYDPASGMFLPPNTVLLVMIWFFLCMTGLVGSIANWAHGIGLVTGLLFGTAPYLWQQLTRGGRD